MLELFDKIAAAFRHGGFWMYPILAIQLVTISIAVERTFVLFKRRKTNQAEFAATFEDNIRRGELDAVIKKAHAAQANNPVAAAIVAGAEVAANFGGKDEIQGKMDEVLLHENAQLDRRTAFLSMLGNVATLTGLLGTITGMIKSFAAVAYSNPAEKASLLAAGISEAMNATAYGLVTAIPALLAYAILQNRSNLLAEDLNQGALKAFNWLSFSFDPVTYKAAPKSRKSNDSNNQANNEINA